MKNNWKKQTVMFLTSQTISLFGTSLVQYAILWHVTLNTQSGLMMMILIICGFLPTFFLSPFAGVWADRFDRKKLIIISDAMIALTTLILAILFIMGYDALWLLFVMSALRAVGTAVQTPAVGAFIPQFVPEDKLMKVNGINGSFQSMVTLISPMASGALLTVASLEAIFMVDVVTAIVAILVLFILHVPVHAKALERHKLDYFVDLKEGMRYIKNHDYIRKFFTFCALFFFLVSPLAFLSPLQVARSFGSDVWRLTATEITFSIGMIIGGLIMATWGGFRNRIHTITFAMVSTGVCALAMGMVPLFWIYLFFMGLSGVVLPLFTTPFTVLLQEKVEEAFLGRVFGVYGMISGSMMPFGMLVFGPIADVIAIEWLLIGTGLLMFFQGFLLLGSKTLIEAGKLLADKK